MTDSRARRRALIVFSALSLLTASWAFSQTNEAVNTGIQFNFANPGARSLALGGAFLGLADDATAAFSNPAGLTSLSKPEISVEGRHWNYRTEYLNGGGPPPTAFKYQRSNNEANGLSFASFVFPAKNWAIAVYRQEQAHFVAKISTGAAALAGGFYARPFDGRADLRITNYGGSIAVRLGGTLSLGASVFASQYNQKAKETLFLINFDSKGNIIGRGDPAFFDSAPGGQTTVSFGVGALWKPSRLLSVGAVYRHGPAFDLSYSLVDLKARTTVGTPCTVSATKKCATFHVPDVYGAGVSVHATDFFTVSVDYDRVQHSQLTDKYTDIVLAGTPDDLSKFYHARNSDEVHLGLQYTIPVGRSALALRAGLWRDPAHGVRYTGPTNNSDSGIQAFQVLQKATFTGGKTEMHYSGGLGVVIGEHVQIDGGYDSAPSVRTASASIVVRF